MTKYELLQESVSDYLFEESVGYLTEGATLDMNKKLRELQAKYRETVKDIKVSYKEKDYKAVEKKCDDLLDIIDKYEKKSMILMTVLVL